MRFGVAPDHPEVKAVQNDFDQVGGVRRGRKSPLGLFRSNLEQHNYNEICTLYMYRRTSTPHEDG